MSQLLERCRQHFDTDNLYDILDVSKDAKKNELKKAYYKKSLVYHPDRASQDDKTEATQKFQVLSQVHCILSDDARRAEYDETGAVDKELSLDQDRNWEDYYRGQVTAKDIEEFTAKYKGSEEELSDLKSVYLKAEGDLDLIMDTMLCAEHEDEPRLVEILQNLISEGELPDYDAFSKEKNTKKKKRSKKAQKEAKEAEEAAKRLKLGSSEDDLMALIANRQASRAQQADSFFAQLEAKYGGAGKSSSSSSSRSKGKKKR